jgi:hypothetical protein
MFAEAILLWVERWLSEKDGQDFWSYRFRFPFSGFRWFTGIPCMEQGLIQNPVEKKTGGKEPDRFRTCSDG